MFVSKLYWHADVPMCLHTAYAFDRNTGRVRYRLGVGAHIVFRFLSRVRLFMALDRRAAKLLSMDGQEYCRGLLFSKGAS